MKIFTTRLILCIYLRRFKYKQEPITIGDQKMDKISYYHLLLRYPGLKKLLKYYHDHGRHEDIFNFLIALRNDGFEYGKI